MSIKPTTHNALALKGVQPERLWHHFAVLSSIPRPSFKETAVKQYLAEFADEHNLTYQEDPAGNVKIGWYGGDGGDGGAVDPSRAVILQGHIDMVTERTASSTHDFDKDPLRLRYDGTWLTAESTTLGADNGVGVCAALAVIERAAKGEISVPPLEVLCTVAEEVGLQGAFGLDVMALEIKGSRLVNLDSEDWPDIFVGCAGGGDSVLRKTVVLERGVKRARYILTISGLPGGHSGLDIHRGIGNAVLVAAELAIQLLAADDVHLVSISGGDKRNALARDAVVCFDAPNDFDIDAMMDQLRKSVGHPDVRVEVRKGSTRDDDRYIAQQDALSILSLLVSLPHGPIQLEADGVNVQTSSNLASIKEENGGYVVQCSTRSSVDAHLARVRRSIRLISERLGFEVEQNEAYPGWQDAGDSPLRSLALETTRKAGVEPKVRTIHAGLEAGILKKKIEAALGRTVDAIAIGPTITGAHSPDERCDVESVQAFYDMLELLLMSL